MRVAIILPTYNERDNVAQLLSKLRKSCQQITNHEIVYVFVDDNSPDGTQDIVRETTKKQHDVVLLPGEKRGLGRALLRGVNFAISQLGADILVQMDADLSHDPKVVPKLLKAIDKGADLVVGSRYIPGGSIPANWGLHRKIYSILGNAFVRFGLGFSHVHDWTGGFRAYKKKFFEEIQNEMTSYSGYVYQIAFLHKTIKRNAKVVEIPIKFTDRRYGKSKIAPSKYIRNIFEYVLSNRFESIIRGPFGKFLVVGTIGFIINTLILEIFVLLGIHPVVGSATGAELAIISNFILNNAWTFGYKRISGDKLFPKFLQFNGTSIGAIGIQAGTVAIGTYLFGLGTYRIYYILGVAIGLFYNFFMYSRVIWR